MGQWGMKPCGELLGASGRAFKNKLIAKLDKKADKAGKPQKIKKAWFAPDKAKDKNDYFILDPINRKKAKLLFDVDGSGRKAAVEVATINYDPKKPYGGDITHKDFFIV